MTANDIDKTGLIRESYLIEGIHASECRSIFLDWAIKLPEGVTAQQAIKVMLTEYAALQPDHPMTQVLRDGMGKTATSGRRGGRKARVEPGD